MNTQINNFTQAQEINHARVNTMPGATGETPATENNILYDLMVDMFGEGGAEEIKEFYKNE